MIHDVKKLVFRNSKCNEGMLAKNSFYRKRGMSEKGKAVLALIVAAVLLSTGGLLIKWIDWNPLAITSTRGIIAVIFFWIFLKRPQFTWSKVQIGGYCLCAHCPVVHHLH